MFGPGDVLQNRYRLTQLLGAGGFSTVYLADDLRFAGRQVAVKIMSLAALPAFERNLAAQRFRQEAQLLAQLDHNGIVDVSDFFNVGEHYCIVMEYVPGQTLTGLLQGTPYGRLEEGQALQITGQLVKVLNYLHQWRDPHTGKQAPIIYRDLKPDNIMVMPNGQIKLLDMGIARFFKVGQTQDTQRLGTPGYAAPEQYGQGQSDARTDIFSLGVLLHQMVTGYNPTITPMHLPPAESLNPHLRPSIGRTIAQATQMNPAARFANVSAFHTALTSPLADSVGAGGMTWQRPVAFAAAGVVLVIALVVGWPSISALLSSAGKADQTTSGPTARPIIVTATEEQVAGGTGDNGPATATVFSGPVRTTAVPTVTPTLTPTTTPSPPPAPTDITATTQGRFVVFTRIDRDTNGDGTVGWSDKRVLFRVDVDSGNTIQLTDYNANAASPSWSPDGRQIVFASDRDGDYELFVMDNDGNNQQQLTFNNATDHGPVWSADGRWLVFHRGTGEVREIFRMRPDGSNEVRLTANNVEDQYPVWSPDGQRIAYESAGRIIIADFDGNMVEELPLSSPFNSAVCWSPDGRYLVYAGHQSQDGAAQIYVWDLIDRSERVVVTDNSGEPCWSPDGSRIVYSRWEPRLPQIWISARFGGGDQRITSSAGYDTQPAWSP